MKEITLPSGRILKVGLAPFSDSKDLYQAFLEELKNLKIEGKQELDHNFLKDIFCSCFSSKKVEEKLFKCLIKCTYNGQRIVESSFEDVESRGDYFDILFEVGKENILPFTKNLYAKLSQALVSIASSQA